MIHTYNTTPEHQQAVFDGLVQGLQTYGARMAGHLSSSIHKGLDGLRVTSYSQWDPGSSKAFRRSRGAAAVTGLVGAADEGCDRPGRVCRWGHPYVHPDERLKPSLRATGGFRGVALRLFPEPAGIATRRSGQATGRKAFVSSLSSNSRLSLPPSSSPVQRSISTSPNTRRGWSVPRRSRRRCGLRATGERRSCRRRWRSSVSSGLSAHGSWEHILWLVASLFIVAVVPVTLPVIFPTNNSLLAPGRDLASPETRALLVKWGRLHAIRSALSLVAAVLFVGLLVAARPFHRAAIRLRAVRSGRVQGAEK